MSQSITRKAMALGALYNRQDLKKQHATGVQLAISAVGLVAIAQDVPPELARPHALTRSPRQEPSYDHGRSALAAAPGPAR